LENLGFELPDGFDAYELAVEVGERQVVEVEQPVSENLAVYDTFDWRLLLKSLSLHHSGEELILRGLDNGEPLLRIETPERPGFAWDLPAGELKERLAPILEMRALIAMVEFQARSTNLRILNRSGKTVARLVHEEMQVALGEGETKSLSHVWLWPVRGYPRYIRNLAGYFRGKGLPACTYAEIHNRILRAAGRAPGAYSSKPDVQLAPEMRTDEAMRKILRFLLEVMRANQAGIQEDIDTEFLHDYRVAIRRTRSALALVGGAFPLKEGKGYRQEFASLGQLTNPLRDLDVYLLKEDIYRRMLPPDLQESIRPMFDHLRSQRSQALQDVIQGLNADEYAHFLQRWEAFLDQTPEADPTAPDAARPVMDVAQEKIYKRYHKILKTGKGLLKHPDDEKLHWLRIECKKLRYLLEFFASLFPPKKIARLVTQLKKLQDNLGDYNDLCIQVDYLLNTAAHIPLQEADSRDTLLAIGCLIGRLEGEKQAVRGAFAETFTEFAALENQQLFQELFASQDARGAA